MVNFEPVDFHPTLVRMSRWLFSQISRERFEAPERYPMPSKSADDFIARELGMKIACGFEMLLADRAPAVDASASDAEPVDDRAWTTFKASLTANGYFRNEMVGSAMYRTLLANAVREYNASPQASMSRRAQRSAPAERVREILAAPESDDDAPRAASPSDASDENWLLEADKALNEELAKLEKERERTVCDATRSARSFVERESGFEGVEQRSRRANHNAAPGACPGDLNIPDGDAGFSLDARKFLSELGKALAIEDDDKLRRYLDADGADFDSDDSDDDFNFPDDSDSDAAVAARATPTTYPTTISSRRLPIPSTRTPPTSSTSATTPPTATTTTTPSPPTTTPSSANNSRPPTSTSRRPAPPTPTSPPPSRAVFSTAPPPTPRAPVPPRVSSPPPASPPTSPARSTSAAPTSP